MQIWTQLLGLKVRHDFIEDLEVPYCTAPITLSNTPLVTRLQERYCRQVWRFRDSSRLMWL